MYHIVPRSSMSAIDHADSIIASSTTKVAKRKVSTALLGAHLGSRNGSEDLT